MQRDVKASVMVIHEDDAPTEVSIVKHKIISQDLHNSITEFNKTGKKRSNISEGAHKVITETDECIKAKKKKSKKPESTFALDCNTTSITEINTEDLNELKSVYKKCKEVIKKIETKYGHLLDIDATDEPLDKHKQNECQCTFNMKIIYDEEGREVSINSKPSNHICPNKLMVHKNDTVVMASHSKNIQIEHHNEMTHLSDNLQELRRILQDPTIETTYRNQVIDKLKLIKQEHLNEVKFNKIALIEKLKTNPEEVLTFSGSNLAVITGYHHF